MRRDLDWVTYHDFMTVVEKGSLPAASRCLRVSQPTVGRKLHEIETKFGVQLFQREIHGCSLTPGGESIVDLCRQMAAKAVDIEHAIAGFDRSKAGHVRIATAVGLGTYWLAPRLPMLKADHSTIDIQPMVSMSMVDPMRQEADVALRIGNPGCDELVGRKIGAVRFGSMARPPICTAMENRASLTSFGITPSSSLAAVTWPRYRRSTTDAGLDG